MYLAQSTNWGHFRGYHQFSFWISKTLANISVFRCKNSITSKLFGTVQKYVIRISRTFTRFRERNLSAVAKKKIIYFPANEN